MAAASRGQVIVWVGRKAIAILPNKDKDLGEVRADQFIITHIVPGGLDVQVVEADSPLVAAGKILK